MHVVLFCHSLVSDWNHGSAHFLRGVARELIANGHRVSIHEPVDGWSLQQLLAEQGDAAIAAFAQAFPELQSRFYAIDRLDLDQLLHDADLVIVHEWSDPRLVAAVSRYRASHGHLRVLFHDTHHRMVSAPDEMARFDLSGFDGVLAFGAVLRELYAAMGWGSRAHTWHEAADVRLFRPMPECEPTADLVWVGNWGDGERVAELTEYLLGPIRALRLDAVVHGVRYPPSARRSLRRAGVRYAGWLPNYFVPDAFATARCTVHVPRRFYQTMLPGIPTIRMFEALACGIPLVSAPWLDNEGLFEAGADYLTASSGADMTRQLMFVFNEPEAAAEIAGHGVRTIIERHTCAHRVEELLKIAAGLGVASRESARSIA